MPTFNFVTHLPAASNGSEEYFDDLARKHHLEHCNAVTADEPPTYTLFEVEVEGAQAHIEAFVAEIGADLAASGIVGATKMTILIDLDGRHIVTVPYTRENLHEAAALLGIGRHWFHATPYAHYDIPKREILNLRFDLNGRLLDLEDLDYEYNFVNTRAILRAIKKVK